MEAAERHTLVLTRHDVRSLLGIADCIDAVEHVLLAHASGMTIPPGILGAHADHGGFHVKTAGTVTSTKRFVAKVNANFPRNPATFGLPTIQGVVALFDTENGRLLALMDSIEITSLRTAAASAVAARHLARRDAASLAVIGCGEQGRSHVRAMRCVRPIASVWAHDTNRERAASFARDMSAETGLAVKVMRNVRDARGADIVVTCTTATQPFLDIGDVAPGAFVAAVGADSPHKHEIAAALLAESVVVVDSLEQAATIGDLHHAIDAAVMTRDSVRAELAAVVAGHVSGRRADDEVLIFDSTGTALQDVAAASLVYERALATGEGLRVMLG
jgi:ornithine cyclodeaminase/alanine dehydrogenase-like protein (mu-crystallin family)